MATTMKSAMTHNCSICTHLLSGLATEKLCFFFYFVQLSANLKLYSLSPMLNVQVGFCQLPKKNLCHNFHQHSRYLLVLAKQFNCTYDHKYRTSLMRSEKKKKKSNLTVTEAMPLISRTRCSLCSSIRVQTVPVQTGKLHEPGM